MTRDIYTHILRLALFGAGLSFAQQPEFEVATIKPSRGGGLHEKITSAPGRLTLANVSLASCIQFAFDVRRGQVFGPAWLDTQRFDIVATAPGTIAESHFRPMFQTLLTDRFKLTLRHETRDLPALALVVAPGGPRLSESQGEGPPSIRSTSLLTFERATIADLVDVMSRGIRDPVLVDQTGLKGRYDFKFDAAPYLPNPAEGAAEPAAIFRSILPQIGLRLESKRLPLGVLIVDHIEKIPSEN